MSKNERSKFLALLLRHKPELANLKVNDEGWISVDELIKNTDFTLNELKNIVSTDNKKRYSFNNTFSYIRANQGHSINVKMNFKEFIPSDYLYHGTSKKYCQSICETGIKKMNRQYVHLSQDINTANMVGKRHGEPIIFKINAIQMYNDGIKFYISENNVILTEYIDKKYIFML